MTDKRLKKLLRELKMDENSVYIPDKEKIIKHVNAKIEKREKKPLVLSGLPKVAVIIAIIVMSLAVTTVAFGKGGMIRKMIVTLFEAPTEVETEEIKEPISGFINNEPETELVTEVETIVEEEEEEIIQEVFDSIEDESFTFIINEALGDNKNMYLTVTVKAKDETAKKELSSIDETWFIIEAFDEINGWTSASCEFTEIKNERRTLSRSYTMHIYGDEQLNGGYGQMRIACNRLTSEEEYIYFEAENKEDVISFELLGQDFAGGYIYLEPMYIELTMPKDPTSDYAPEARNLNTFFKFKNGSVKTMNQVAEYEGFFNYIGGEDNLYKFTANTKIVINTDNLESVIVRGIEYPVSEPENYTYNDVPERLKPFVVVGEGKRSDEFYYVCSVNQLSPCINITNEEDAVIEFTYSGKSYRVEKDNLTVVVNENSEYTLYLAPYEDEEGNLWIGSDFLNHLLGIRYDVISQTGTFLMVP